MNNNIEEKILIRVRIFLKEIDYKKINIDNTFPEYIFVIKKIFRLDF